MSEYLRPLSPSSVNTFCNCPHSFKLKYIDGIKFPSGEAAAFGSCIHKVLEKFWDEYVAGEDVEKAIQESVNKYWDKNITDEYDEAAHDCLNHAISIIKERSSMMPLYTEYSCVNDANNTIAIIDLVIPGKIIDYKTSKVYTVKAKQPNIVQATMCSMNLEHKTGQIIREVEFEYLRWGKYQRVFITDEMIEDMNILISKVRTDIENDVFPKNEKSCWFCDYSLLCKADKRALERYSKKAEEKTCKKFLVQTQLP